MAGKPVPFTFGCGVNVLEPPADWGRFNEQLQEARSNRSHLVKILTGVGARELERIVDIATECGLKVAGHIPRGVSVFEAIEAGMHGIEHASGYDRLVGDFSELRRAIRLSASRRVFNCPSIDWYRVYSTELDARAASATIRMAEFFGEEAEWGTVEVGKKARLLLLEKDPLASLEAIGEIRAVVLDGRMVGRNELKSSLQQSLEPLGARVDQLLDQNSHSLNQRSVRESPHG